MILIYSKDLYDINSVLIKNRADLIFALNLCYMDKCFSAAYFTDSLKIAKLIPIYKRGIKDNM